MTLNVLSVYIDGVFREKEQVFVLFSVVNFIYFFIGEIVKRVILFLLLILIIFPQNTLAKNISKASIVLDINSGRILYQNNSNQSLLIASTTKIMTFFVTLKYAYDKLDNEVTVGEEVLKMYGTNMYLSLGEKLKLKDLLYGLMLRSGNDASVVISTYVAGSIDNFVYLMNEEAKKIGMQNTVFKNPHGLDEETKNYSTAYDLAILTRYLYLNYPLYKQIAGSKYYDFKSNLKSYSLTNRSKIIFTYDNITTAKNGYTPSAGKSLVTTASNNDLELLIVTLNDYNIYENHQELYDYYFSKYKNTKILDKKNFKAPKGLFETDYYIENDFYYPITDKENIDFKIIVDDNKDYLGHVEVRLDNKVIHEEKIYSKKIKPKKENFIQRFLKFFKNIFNSG